MSVQLLTVPVQGAFDAKDPAHRKVFADFLNSGKWNKRFSLEYPFSNVPAMIMTKLATYAVELDGYVIRPIGNEKVRLEQEKAVEIHIVPQHITFSGSPIDANRHYRELLKEAMAT